MKNFYIHTHARTHKHTHTHTHTHTRTQTHTHTQKTAADLEVCGAPIIRHKKLLYTHSRIPSHT